jgi:hypothetical protein
LANNHIEDTGIPGYLYYKLDHLWTYITQDDAKLLLYQHPGQTNVFCFVRYFKDKSHYNQFLNEWEVAFAETTTPIIVTDGANTTQVIPKDFYYAYTIAHFRRVA